MASARHRRAPSSACPLRRPPNGRRECIGNYTPEEQPDKDLGRSIRPGGTKFEVVTSVYLRSALTFLPQCSRALPITKTMATRLVPTFLYPLRFQDGGVTQMDFLTATAKGLPHLPLGRFRVERRSGRRTHEGEGARRQRPSIGAVVLAGAKWRCLIRPNWQWPQAIRRVAQWLEAT